MNDSTFDPDAFMNTQVDAPMATALAGVPDGEYIAMIGDFDSSAFKTITYTNDQGQQVSRPVLELPYIIDDATLKAQLGREQVTHRETYWLDMLPGGGLDTGPDKNVNLGKLREALGQNVAGQAWAPNMLRNMGPLRIVIRSRTDKKNTERKFTNITKYARIS